MMNIIIFGFIIVLNSMIRFDNPIFSCSFWLTCNQDSSISFGSNLIFQVLLSGFGMVTLMIAFISQQNILEKKRFRKFQIIMLWLGSLVFITSLYALVINPIHPVVQSVLSLILTVLLTILFVKRKNIGNNTLNNSVKNHSSFFLLLSSVIMIGLGVLIGITGAAKMCDQFPVCLPLDGFSLDVLLVNAHRLFTLITGIFIMKMAFTTWRRYRENLDTVIFHHDRSRHFCRANYHRWNSGDQ